MKKNIFILSLLLMQVFAFGQAPSIEWQKCLGGTTIEVAYDIKPALDGGYIAVGYTYSNDVDVSGLHGLTDAWVVKMSSTGSIVWQKAIGGLYEDYAYRVQITSDGGCILAGTTQSQDGDVVGNHGGYDAWVVKLSSTGTIQWQKCLGGTDSDRANSIKKTPDGGYIVAGQAKSTNGDVAAFHYGNGWIVKLSSTGVIQWQKSIGSYAIDYVNDIELAPNGGYIVTGGTQSNNGTGLALIMKLSSTGNIVWTNNLQTDNIGINDNWIYGKSIISTSDGGYMMIGDTKSNSINGILTGIHGYVDILVAKLSSTGTVQWLKCFGGIGDDHGESIQKTTDGNYIIAGYTSSDSGDSGDVVGIHGTIGGRDGWVFKISNNGNLIWQKCFGGVTDEEFYSLSTTTDGGYIMAGTALYDDGDVLGINGTNDFWVVKVTPDLLTTTTFNDKELKIFPNPANQFLNLKTSQKIENISIADVSGKIVFNRNNNLETIDVSKLAKGIYFLNANIEGKIVVEKFIKE